MAILKFVSCDRTVSSGHVTIIFTCNHVDTSSVVSDAGRVGRRPTLSNRSTNSWNVSPTVHAKYGASSWIGVDWFSNVVVNPISDIIYLHHSVESPSMVDPQWNIWYWGSKWNLHTVCWSEVGCEWGTTSVYFGITYVCFIPSRLPVFAVEPQYLLQYFLLLSKVSFELHIQNLQKISCWFKTWMGFVGPILIKLWTSSIWGFL